jgi:peptidoglycan hydrolase CwlO-like protein
MKPFPLPSLTSLPRPAALALLCLAFSSCGDDPALVIQRDKQKAELVRLDYELKMLQEKIDQIPPDRSSEISKLKVESEDQQGKITALEQEIERLQAEKAEVEKKHEAYRRKYVVR